MHVNLLNHLFHRPIFSLLTPHNQPVSVQQIFNLLSPKQQADYQSQSINPFIPRQTNIDPLLVNTTNVYATVSGNQTITENTATTITFNSETIDTLNEFNTSTYQFSPKYSGLYLVDCHFQITPIYPRVIARIMTSGGTTIVHLSDGDAYTNGDTVIVQMDAGTNYAFNVWIIGGVGGTLNGAPHLSWLRIFRLK